ncbi:MAG: heme-binding domain-containing protein [Akkermansia sp.]|nr:heme-binding domain-containing protein [Akkermansia sp.]
MNKKITPYLFGLSAAAVTIGAAGVLSAIILPAEGSGKQLPTPATPQEAKGMATAVMDSKCADCHGEKPAFNGLMNLLSLGQMKRDIQGAQRAFTMKPDASVRSANVDFMKMDQVLRTRSMPPALYTAVHPGTALTLEDVAIMRHYYSSQEAMKRAFAPVRPADMSNDEHTAYVWGLPDAASNPDQNTLAKAWGKVYLGHRLYFDPRLSTTNEVSCASCHDLTKGGTDNLPKSEGVPGSDGKPQLGGVNAPTVYNAEHNIRQFWDGRAADLQEQAGGPPLNPVEMGYSHPDDWKAIADKLSKDAEYKILFPLVYGEKGITAETITDAIAAFERTLVTPDSAFDKYLAGDDKAMTEQQKKGMEAFLTYGCATCHAGPTMGGQSFEYVNTHSDLRAHAKDYKEGAFGLMDFTKKEEHKDMFRVPNLRNVALTAPYFHTGTVDKLEDAVRIMFETQTRKTPSDALVADVTAFLQAQTGCYKGIPLNELTPKDVKPEFVSEQLPGSANEPTTKAE